MKKIRVKIFDKWKSVSPDQLYEMTKNHPADEFSVKSECSHDETFIEHGVKRCGRCNDV
tara:strand:+ start:10390 stop:10566 length:177 start_codon:yes stop_codon:yes gene_type:complete